MRARSINEKMLSRGEDWRRTMGVGVDEEFWEWVRDGMVTWEQDDPYELINWIKEVSKELGEDVDITYAQEIIDEEGELTDWYVELLQRLPRNDSRVNSLFKSYVKEKF